MKYINIIIFLLFINTVFAQNYSTDNKKAIKYYKKAEKFFDDKKFEKTIENCNKSITIDVNFVESYLLLSKTYYYLENTELELSNLKKALAINANQKDEVLTVGIIEFENKNYIEAKKYYENYLNFNGLAEWDKKETLRKIKICQFRIDAPQNPVPFEPSKLPQTINSPNSEYFPSLTPDENTLIFTRLQETKNNFPQEDIFVSYKQKSKWTEAVSISKKINSQYNEGANTISSDGNIMIFTRCSKADGCDLLLSYINNNQWVEPFKINNSINSSHWDSQPCISSDGKTIYFVSNRPAGKGKMDIWKIERKEDGKWSKAINLGDSINTPGNEMSPFIHSDEQTLYFSSDYWAGMGGMDLFLSRKDENNSWSIPTNLGYPINTDGDDMRIIVNTKGNIAYFSSNRDSIFKQDIFTFNLYPAIQPKRTIYVKGTIFDVKTSEKIEAKYEIFNIKNKNLEIIDSLKSDFLICLPVENNFLLNVSKESYLFYSENFSLENLSDTIDYYHINIYMKPIEIGETIILKNIFFKTNLFTLEKESNIELDKLLLFLQTNSKLKIEIGGHTDNVGTKEHNEKLSDNRAKAVKEYLIDKGINENRILYKGYGYSQPIATNLTEHGRAQNRRTEFKILDNK